MKTHNCSPFFCQFTIFALFWRLNLSSCFSIIFVYVLVSLNTVTALRDRWMSQAMSRKSWMCFPMIWSSICCRPLMAPVWWFLRRTRMPSSHPLRKEYAHSQQACLWILLTYLLLKEMLIKKIIFCHYLLTFMSFQTCRMLFLFTKYTLA